MNKLSLPDSLIDRINGYIDLDTSIETDSDDALFSETSEDLLQWNESPIQATNKSRNLTSTYELSENYVTEGSSTKLQTKEVKASLFHGVTLDKNIDGFKNAIELTYVLSKNVKAPLRPTFDFNVVPRKDLKYLGMIGTPERSSQTLSPSTTTDTSNKKSYYS